MLIIRQIILYYLDKDSNFILLTQVTNILKIDIVFREINNAQNIQPPLTTTSVSFHFYIDGACFDFTHFRSCKIYLPSGKRL